VGLLVILTGPGPTQRSLHVQATRGPQQLPTGGLQPASPR